MRYGEELRAQVQPHWHADAAIHIDPRAYVYVDCMMLCCGVLTSRNQLSAPETLAEYCSNTTDVLQHRDCVWTVLCWRLKCLDTTTMFPEPNGSHSANDKKVNNRSGTLLLYDHNWSMREVRMSTHTSSLVTFPNTNKPPSTGSAIAPATTILSSAIWKGTPVLVLELLVRSPP